MLWLVGQGLERNEIRRHKTERTLGERYAVGPVGMRKKSRQIFVSHTDAQQRISDTSSSKETLNSLWMDKITHPMNVGQRLS